MCPLRSHGGAGIAMPLLHFIHLLKPAQMPVLADSRLCESAGMQGLSWQLGSFCFTKAEQVPLS